MINGTKLWATNGVIADVVVVMAVVPKTRPARAEAATLAGQDPTGQPGTSVLEGRYGFFEAGILDPAHPTPTAAAAARA